MKNELKTLKDLNLNYKQFEDEAIKNYLRLEIEKLLKMCFICSTAYPKKICSNHWELAKWANISEEDLK